MNARIPATNQESSGMRLVRHTVRVTLEDGFSRTEVEEEFHNDTRRVLEGQFEFALPSNASISRMSLLVGSSWIDAEMVERSRARAIYNEIVNPRASRDPALLEKNAARISLRVFPIPAFASRRVAFTYDQPLERTPNGFRYAYPLPAGEAPIRIEHFSIDVSVRDGGRAPAEVENSWAGAETIKSADRIRVRSSDTGFVPTRDFVVDYPSSVRDVLPVVVQRDGSSSYFAVRVPIPAIASLEMPSERAIVIDKSASQDDSSLAEERALVMAILRRAPRTRFAILACDAACTAYPKRGTLAVTADSIEAAREWLANIEPSGASDVAGSIETGIRRLAAAADGKRAQIIYIGDGNPSAGELTSQAIAERVKALLASGRALDVDLRLVGSGRELDLSALAQLAALSGASSHGFSGQDPLSERIERVVTELSMPSLALPKVELDDETIDSTETLIASQGGDVLVLGRLQTSRPKNLTLFARIGDQEVRIRRALEWPNQGRERNPWLPRLWAEARIGELERAGDETSRREIERLSIAHHVLSRETALIALENDAMFRQYGLRGSQTGRGHGALPKPHRVRVPQLRMGMTTVSGRMPPESIRRVLRQNFGRFRACYQRGLLKRPGLEGRVVLRFVIDRTGRVVEAVERGSELADRDVVDCMVAEVRELRFPAPDVGIIGIEYPLKLSPSETRESFPPEPGPYQTARIPENAPEPRLPEVSLDDDGWMEATPFSAPQVIADVASERGNRFALESKVRNYLAQGRFESAALAAKLFTENDPDNGRALYLLAETAALSGDRGRLLAAVAGQAELEPKNVIVQERAAQVFAWAGERTRACAHFRAGASLAGADERTRQASRACAAARPPSEPVPRPAAALSVDLECRSKSGCPTLVVISSSGAVASEALRGTRGAVEISSLDEEWYRVLAIGGDPSARAAVRVTLDGKSTRYPILPEGPRTIAIVRTSGFPSVSWLPAARL